MEVPMARTRFARFFMRFDVLSEAAAARESVAWRIQQEVLHDCALLPPSSNPVAALSVGDSHGL